MHILHRAYDQIVSYRLGYSPQCPYPWRWTTPISLSVFLLLASVLAVINVPLSAYELNQESTFRPNDTLSPLPFYNLIPKILQHPTDSFTPQILTIGDRIKLNQSLFEFTIFAAFDRPDNATQTPSAFLYYNNPFSDGCDVVRLGADITLDSEDQQVQLTGSHLGRDLENQTVGVELEAAKRADRIDRSLQRVMLSLERHGILEHMEGVGTVMEHALKGPDST
ncbi:hypothetical protein FB451DRAFT_1554181 [Mycena latifolia]|nr:hypothetical protein FB451DRAFT_1554181 [Mycena latifolia]